MSQTRLPIAVDQAKTITAYDNRSPARHQCVALVPGTQAQFTHDVTNLLRQRLRVAGLIALVGFVLFYIKAFIFPPNPERSLELHFLVMAEIGLLCGLLYSPTRWSLRNLRLMELLMFGSMGVYFLYLQYANFNHGE